VALEHQTLLQVLLLLTRVAVVVVKLPNQHLALEALVAAVLAVHLAQQVIRGQQTLAAVVEATEFQMRPKAATAAQAS